MVWLWLLFPIVVLATVVVLWRTIGRLTTEGRALQAEVDALAPVGEAARALRRGADRRPAIGQEPADR